MALANGIRFIWLDQYIGQEGECHQFKRMFRTALESTTVMPPDQIDSLICALNENAAPFLFADTCDGAIELIERENKKKIIFISSGLLGQQIIPQIKVEYPQVHSFYIFCALIEKHAEFAADYLSCLSMFDNEIDLLVRLTRNISKDIITQGKDYLNLKCPNDALKCFENARILNITANAVDTLNDPVYSQLRILDNYEGNIGLIQIAKNMFNQQQYPETTKDHEHDEQISQQESGEQ
ncbi:hypothetical protein I4U23_007239 [Adineta vaga]|nr:hypothetical protein I4U23_007239 [Adineta vaga]